MDERYYWLGFSVFSGIGPITFGKLLDAFGTAKATWEADVPSLKHAGFSPTLVEKFSTFRTTFSLETYQETLQKKDIQFLIATDKEYPKRLRIVEKAPFVLYIKGTTDFNNDRTTVGVVGTRKTTHYGREVTGMLATELVYAEMTIVSGLALGVDSIAHMAAVKAKKKTIAVLGSGVDYCHPTSNQRLYDEILATGGSIVSEVPIGQLPTKGLFPARNRIIAGLSDATIVTEGAEDSGALITADYAFSYGRKVFAVPGPITSGMSKGPYKLIAKGATLITSASDVIKELGIKNHALGKNKKKITGGTKEEQMIIDLLQQEPFHFDRIVRETGMSTQVIAALLSLMELKGSITVVAQDTYVIAS